MTHFLESLEAALPWLSRAGFSDPAAAHRDFLAIAQRGVPLDLIDDLRDELAQYLPACADPDMALNNFERMLAAVRSPLSFVTFLLRKPHSLAVLIQLFTTSQYFSDLIINSPEYFDFLWESGHEAIEPAILKEEILGEIRSLDGHDDRVLNLIRRHRQRELLRIGYRDIVLGEPLDRITTSVSDLADCLVEVALTVAYEKPVAKYGEPMTPEGKVARLVVLGMGKLGGRELNYSSDIDLILIYDEDGKTTGPKVHPERGHIRDRQVGNAEFFTHVIREMVRLLSANTARGQAYRVDLRLRPHGMTADLCMSLKGTLGYYDHHGRTWERQALVKVRPIAGSMSLGAEFLRAIEPFIYRRYLNYVEINEIKSIKRQIEAKARDAGVGATDLKTGHGGIRDIEFVTQFLQLVNGGSLPEIRERNTLFALRKLGVAGCISPDEHTALETAYRFLRKAEHRLQFMFDLQTHRIPDAPAELDKLALRLGYLSGDSVPPGEQFIADLRLIADRNRAILKRLMLDLFREESPGAEGGEPETDLILDPQPAPERIREILGRYPFSDADAAYKNLCHLAREDVPFLSSVRCRHFLASVAPRLLRAIAEAPDPDMALVNLEKVTASLGAKSALWESFSLNPPLLRLYVHLCSWSQFLSEILINNPGMIDELLDTLVLNQSPTLTELENELNGLLKGAREVDPILHSFKNTRLLGIGVHDILGKHTLQQTTQQLSELAQAVIGAVAELHRQRLAAQFGTPMLAARPNVQSEYAIIGLGKFGGHELSYHSDLDLILVYDGDGQTAHETANPWRETTSNHHFYTELVQRIVKTAGQMGPFGRLYQVDLRLRPTGRSGSLVLPLEKFAHYYREGSAALWERQALTRARVVHGDPIFARRLEETIRRTIRATPWKADFVEQIRLMRDRLASSRGPKDLKRGPGGVVDIEFAVQMMQLKYADAHPDILCSNVWESLEAIAAAGLWDPEMIDAFHDGYTFLRTVESRLRIVHNLCRDDLPDSTTDIAKLAFRLGYEGKEAGDSFQADIARRMKTVRSQYLACLEREQSIPPE